VSISCINTIETITNQRMAILLKTRLAIVITRSTFGSPLHILVDSFRIGVSIVHGIVIELCHVLEKKL